MRETQQFNSKIDLEISLTSRRMISRISPRVISLPVSTSSHYNWYLESTEPFKAASVNERKKIILLIKSYYSSQGKQWATHYVQLIKLVWC